MKQKPGQEEEELFPSIQTAKHTLKIFLDIS